MRWQTVWAGPFFTSSPGTSLLELDHDLYVVLFPDVAGPLYPTSADRHHRAGDDVSREVLPEWAFAVLLGHDRNPVSGHLDQQVIELVPVNGAFLARPEPHLPHPTPVVLEEELRSHVA